MWIEEEVIDLVSSSDDEVTVAVNNNDNEEAEAEDEVVVEYPHHNNGPVEGGFYHVNVNGKPCPMPRPSFMAWVRNSTLHRRVVNNARGKMAEYRQAFIEEMYHYYNIESTSFPLFPTGGVVMIITACRRLPNAAFIGGDRMRGLRSGFYTDRTYEDTMTPDGDNLGKFVMDALNGIIYTDDAQVTKLEVVKILDNKHPFLGKTILDFRQSVHTDFPEAIPEHLQLHYPLPHDLLD